MDGALFVVGILAILVPSYFQLRSMDDTKLHKVRQDLGKVGNFLRKGGVWVVNVLPFAVAGYWIVRGWNGMATDPLTEGDVSLFVGGVALLVFAGMFMVFRLFLSRSNQRHRDSHETTMRELQVTKAELSNMATAAIVVVDAYKADLNSGTLREGLLSQITGESNPIPAAERKKREEMLRHLNELRGKLSEINGTSLLKMLGNITNR